MKFMAKYQRTYIKDTDHDNNPGTGCISHLAIIDR